MSVLGAAGHKLHALSRHAGIGLPAGVGLSVWDGRTEPPRASLENADVVVHLAGEPVAQRWTPAVKQRIRDSRVLSTGHLVQAISKLSRRPGAFVCASAIGYYGPRGDEMLPESAAPGPGFLEKVCVEWENTAQAASALGLRVTMVRIGVALDTHGGALARMLPPFRLGIGGPIASGSQWMSWIHLADLAELLRFVIENPISGPVNGVAPYPATNREFTRTLAEAIRRPAFFPIPAFGLKLLLGEMAELLLASQRVIPQAAESAGFRFRFPKLGPALGDLLASR